MLRLEKDCKESKARLKELEQHVAGGYKTGMGTTIEHKGSAIATVVDREEFRSVFKGQSGKAVGRFDTGMLFKNTIMGESGSPQNPDGALSQALRLPGVVPGAFRALNFLDMVPRVLVTQTNLVEYPKESAWTNDAAETAEGGTKPESDLTFENVEVPVRTIAHWIKTSKQAAEDSPWLVQYLSNRLIHGVRQRLQYQVINGNGTAPNISGITASGNHTAFTPETGETELDSLNRAKYLIQAADYEPNFILMHPSSMGSIERLKRGTDTGYLLGDGMGAMYVTTGLDGRTWSLPIVTSNAIASGKFVMGDIQAMRLLMRQEATLEVFPQDGDNVQKNLLTWRAELRAALAVMQPDAIQYGDLTI